MEYYRVKWNELQKIYPHGSVLKFYTREHASNTEIYTYDSVYK